MEPICEEANIRHRNIVSIIDSGPGHTYRRLGGKQQPLVDQLTTYSLTICSTPCSLAAHWQSCSLTILLVHKLARWQSVPFTSDLHRVSPTLGSIEQFLASTTCAHWQTLPSLQISHELVYSYTNRIQIVFVCQLTFSTLAANLYTNCFLSRCNIACAALGPPAHEHCLKGCRHCLHTSCPTELYAVRHCLLTTCRTESAEENDSTNCRLQIVAFSLAFESSLAFE